MAGIKSTSLTSLKSIVKSLPGADAAIRLIKQPAPDFMSYGRAVDTEAMRAAATCDMERQFYAHGGRLAHKWHHYLGIYDRYLSPYRAGFPLADGGRRPLRFLEIGVSHGGSLQLWRKFFGPEAILFGIDINPKCAGVTDPDLNVRIGSQADEGFLRSVVAEMGGVDVIVEDGSHIAEHQAESFRVLFPLLTDGGLYIGEDLHTSYWKHEYNGGYQRRGTFIELAKQLVDDMHAWYHAEPIRLVDAHRQISGVSFHDSLVVIEKQRKDAPFHVQIGTPSF